jgi:flagellar biogenesis protein FliO
MQFFMLSIIAPTPESNVISGISIWEIVKALGALSVIVVLSMSVLWFYGKRAPRLNKKNVMAVIDWVALERNARVYLLRVGDNYVLAGVSKDGVSHLSNLEKSEKVHFESDGKTSPERESGQWGGFDGFLKRAKERIGLKADEKENKGI